jgi:hypothetical protein
MSNASCLLANDIPGPAGFDEDAVGYDPETDLVALGPMAIPVYWLSMFKTSHILNLEVAGEDEPVTVPSLVTEMSEARKLLHERQGAVCEAFPEFAQTFDQFATVIDRLPQRFLKVDMQELWGLEPDDFLEPVESALRWFDSGSREDFAQLLSVASIEAYDTTTRTFPGLGSDVPRAFHFRGYACNESYWDDDADR